MAKRLINDVIATVTTQAAVVLVTFLIYAMIARVFGAPSVGEYTIIRRSLYVLQPAILIGVTVAVPRYLAMTQDSQARAQIAAIGLAAVSACSLIVALLFVVERGRFSQWLFLRPDAEDLVYAFALLTLAFGFHSYAYSYYRGLRDMLAANRLDIVNSAIVPLVALAAASASGLSMMIATMAILMIASTALQSASLKRDVASVVKQRRADAGAIRSVLSYGVPRIPGDLALAGLLFGSAYLSARRAGMLEAGYFGVAQTLLMLPGAALAALSVVLLPYVSERLAAGDRSAVHANAAKLFHAIADCATYFSLHVSISAAVLLNVWLGDEMTGATRIVCIVMVSAPFYSLYFVFRSVIDAATSRPITTINLVLSLACFAFAQWALTTLGLDAATAIAWAFSFAFIVLGVLTVAGVAVYVGINGFFDIHTVWMLGTNSAIAVGLWAIYGWLQPTMLARMLIEFLTIIIFVVAAIVFKRQWALAALARARTTPVRLPNSK